MYDLPGNAPSCNFCHLGSTTCIVGCLWRDKSATQKNKCCGAINYNIFCASNLPYPTQAAERTHSSYLALVVRNELGPRKALIGFFFGCSGSGIFFISCHSFPDRRKNCQTTEAIGAQIKQSPIKIVIKNSANIRVPPWNNSPARNHSILSARHGIIEPRI